MPSSAGSGAASGAMSGATVGSSFGPVGTVVGAVVGGAAGYFAGKGKKAQVDPYGTLNPEQKRLVKFLGPQIQSEAAAGPQYYTDQMTAEMTPEEAGFYNPTRSSLLSQDYDQLIKEGTDPTALNDAFNREVATPTYQNFNQNEAPGIIEDYSAFGTQGANRLAQMRATLGNNLMTQRFAATQAAKDRALAAVDRTPTLQNYFAAPRVFQQAGLDRKYADYIQGNATKQKNIDNALAFLGVSTGTYQAGVPDTRFAGLFSGALQGAGTVNAMRSGTTTTGGTNIGGGYTSNGTYVPSRVSF